MVIVCEDCNLRQKKSLNEFLITIQESSNMLVIYLLIVSNY